MIINKKEVFLAVRNCLEGLGWKISGGNDESYTLFREPDSKIFVSAIDEDIVIKQPSEGWAL